MSKRKRARVIDVRPADSRNQVVTIEGGGDAYRRTPCPGCPWRVDQVGSFPAQAFIHSANTAYDMAERTFACHESGAKNPATCAGFLLRNSVHNFGARIKRASGKIGNDVHDGGIPLHRSYRAMAVANGVPADHPALARCRADNE